MAPLATNDARAVANYLLAKAGVEQNQLDPLKLLKLVYISHGWHLGLTGCPLVNQTVFAWPYGPVIPEVYRAFSRFGSSPIGGQAVYFDYEANTWKAYQPNFDANTKDIVDRVWDAYKNFSGSQLSTLTHKQGTPWAMVTAGLTKDRIRDILIPNDIIQSHYRELALKNQRAKELAGGTVAQ